LTKKVVVSSFHTCSAYELAERQEEFDAVISFDSHIDAALVGFRDEVLSAIEDDWPMRYTCGRPATHVIMSKLLEFSDGLFLISPEKCIESHAAGIQRDDINWKSSFLRNWDQGIYRCNEKTL